MRYCAYAGIAGGVPLAAAATDGITTPVLYNPYLAAGSRYTELADSAIQRLYHSNAFLLTSGLVCDTLSFLVVQHICMSDNVAIGHNLQVSKICTALKSNRIECCCDRSTHDKNCSGNRSCCLYACLVKAWPAVLASLLSYLETVLCLESSAAAFNDLPVKFSNEAILPLTWSVGSF